MAVSIEEQLALFALAPVRGDAALAMMRLSLFDWASCGIAGQGEPVAQIVRSLVLGEGGTEQSTMIGGQRVPMRAAALVNGTISHALDYDDTHFAHIGHPSVAVIPAALAVAEHIGAKGSAFLDACLVGVEASIRVGLWLGRGHYQVGFHQTATAGAFGATVAASRLMGLSEAQIAHAVALVSTRASGLKSQFGTMGKPFNAGLAASNGVEAAILAQNGFVSNPGALHGTNGFSKTHHGAGDGGAFQDLGTKWLFETISHKFHACCHGLHAMIEALTSVDLDDANIRSVDVTTHPRWLTVCNNLSPSTGLETKFSYRHTAAMALLGVETGALESYCDSNAVNSSLVDLRDRVTVTGDDTLSETQARVFIQTQSGRHELFHDLAAPMSFDDRVSKVSKKARALLGDTQAMNLKNVCDDMNVIELTFALAQ